MYGNNNMRLPYGTLYIHVKDCSAIHTSPHVHNEHTQCASMCTHTHPHVHTQTCMYSCLIWLVKETGVYNVLDEWRQLYEMVVVGLHCKWHFMNVIIIAIVTVTCCSMLRAVLHVLYLYSYYNYWFSCHVTCTVLKGCACHAMRPVSVDWLGCACECHNACVSFSCCWIELFHMPQVTIIILLD